MTLPAEVEIGPFTYEVSTDEDDIDDLAPSAFGAIDPVQLLIALEPGQDIGQMRDSLLHEVLHGACFVASLDQDTDLEILEDVIRRVSPVLLDVIRRNPLLVSFLIEP